jgi:hypothetical protein
MALPQIVPPTTAGTGGRHVFISYSHVDGELAGRFMRSLWALAGNQPELRLAPERMFYDRDKLKAGDDWDGSIQSHLRRADLFPLLVSMNSLTSAYCLTRELEEAARLGQRREELRRGPDISSDLTIADRRPRFILPARHACRRTGSEP